MAQCDTNPGPEITPPEYPSLRDQFLAVMGWQEILIDKEDVNGNTVSVYVVGRVSTE